MSVLYNDIQMDKYFEIYADTNKISMTENHCLINRQAGGLF